MGVRSRVHRVGAAALMVPAVVGAQAGAPATSALPAPVQAVPVPTAPVHATESPVQPVTAPVGEPAQRPGDLVRTIRSHMTIDRDERRTKRWVAAHSTRRAGDEHITDLVMRTPTSSEFRTNRRDQPLVCNGQWLGTLVI